MRQEFSKAVKREALKRSGGLCEAEGELYGTKFRRCNAPLSYGVEFDHILACSNGGDNSLENCLAICPACHKYKTTVHDTPRAAKIKRVSDKHSGIVKPKGTIKSRGFQQWEPNVKQLHEEFSE
jgi:5-methylcytosine-specific restriction endonuclease McrA